MPHPPAQPAHPAQPAQPAQPDAIYADPRLAACYDTFDGERDDLDHYRAILTEHGARSVLDVGCGTGSLATSLALEGLTVTGVDPARASLEIGRAKPGGEAGFAVEEIRDAPDRPGREFVVIARAV